MSAITLTCSVLQRRAPQVVDFGAGGPVRCAQCKAYMNPFMQFVGDGARFRCNFCGALSDTPHDYVAATGPNGRAERPELCCGTVEIVATPDFLVRAPAQLQGSGLMWCCVIARSSSSAAAPSRSWPRPTSWCARQPRHAHWDLCDCGV